MKDQTMTGAAPDFNHEVAKDDDGDLISVVMSNFCGASWLAEAIQSVRDQTHRRLELIIVDDASTDDSVAIIRMAMATDPRIKLIECPKNLGPAGCRNLALDAARGAWIAIMDSDDLMHPARLQRLLAAAQSLDCDVVADDMIFFGQSASVGGRTLLQPLQLVAPRRLSLIDFLRSDNGGSGLPPYGYLKPLIRRTALAKMRYDTTLRVGEDFDFCARLLLQGARYDLLPDPMYLYRRHSTSLSHRLTTDVLRPLLAAHSRLEHAMPRDNAGMAVALLERRNALTWALLYAELVAALKAVQAGTVLRLLAGHPRLVKPIWQSLKERRNRRTLTARSPARTPLQLVLQSPVVALEARAKDQLGPDAKWIFVPSVAPAGTVVSAPLAPLAAELSRLAGHHDLDVLVVGPEARFAAGMLPPGALLRHGETLAAANTDTPRQDGSADPVRSR